MPMRTLELRLYPSQDQHEAIGNQLGLCRRLYNLALEHRSRLWRFHDAGITKTEQQAQLVRLKEAFPEFRAAPAQVLQDVIKRLDRAFENFFEDRAAYPRFKGRASYRSMTFPQNREGGRGCFECQDGQLYLTKVGWVRAFHEDKPAWLTDDAVAKTCVVKEDRYGNWWAYVTFDVPEDAIKREDSTGPAVGVDLGLIHLATLSNGDTITNPRHVQEAEEKLAWEQRKLDRKQQGSNNYHRQREQVAKVHRDVARKRTDHLHKITRRLAREHSLIAVEDSLDGLREGERAKQVQDAGWGRFVRLLAYKCQEHGTWLVKVNPAHTSQDCSECGNRVKKSLWERRHECSECGACLDRDVNAARNILERGLAKLGEDDIQVPAGCGEQTPVDTRGRKPLVGVGARG